MTTTKTRSREEIQAEIDTIVKIEVHVATNQGTYSNHDAVRAVGVGDPALANREVYETVGGARRATGPSEEMAPGRMRRINTATLAGYRQTLAALRAELRTAR